MDRYQAIATFIAVCDTNGFTPAARKLGMSPSVATRHVAYLEERLGVRLLQRTTRSVRLTAAGQVFLDRARRILGDLDEAEMQAQGEATEPRGRLVITAPLLFGRLHVAPILLAFMHMHPAVSAQLHLSDGIANLIDDGVDLAIRIGQLPDSQLVAKRVGVTSRIVVASPDYLERRGTPQTPGELAEHDLVAFTALTPTPDWSFFTEGKEMRVRVSPRFSTNGGEAAIAAAIAGEGLTAVLCYQVQDALDNGTLVEVLTPFEPPVLPIQAVYPSSRLLSSKVRLFIDLIEARTKWRLS